MVQFLPEDEEYLPEPKSTIEEINRMLAAQQAEDVRNQEAVQEAQVIAEFCLP